MIGEKKFTVINDLRDGLHFVDGKRCTIQAEKTFPVYEPRSGKVVAQCPISDPAEVDRVAEITEKAQPEWGNKHVFERAKVLRNVATLIRENLDVLARWEVLCNGKPIYEARVDLESSADTFDFYAGAAATVLSTGSQYELPGGPQKRFAYSRRQPYGVVGAIGAWNYPFQTCVWKVAPALAAGNAVVYKPSPFAPISPVLVGELLTAAGLPNGVYSVIQGEAETGQALCHNNRINKVSFTGSVATGKAIQRACAENNIKPVTLELGGKSPLIIFEDSDIKSAVSAAMLANFLNQGQVCTNATRVFVQKSILPQFTEELLKEADAKLKVGDPLKEDTRVGASINESHLNRVIGFVESAKQEGATVLRGGTRVRPEGVEDGFYFDPAILSNLNDSMKVVRDEIFGAVLLLLPFETEEEVVRRANDTGFGLATGVYSGNLARGHRMASKLDAGTVYINTYNDADVHVPFGGFKESGHGRENCVEALTAFTQIKAVYVNVEDKLDHSAKEVVLAEKPLISWETDLLEPSLLDQLVCHIGSLASVYHKPPTAFVDTARQPLRNFGDTPAAATNAAATNDSSILNISGPSTSAAAPAPTVIPSQDSRLDCVLRNENVRGRGPQRDPEAHQWTSGKVPKCLLRFKATAKDPERAVLLVMLATMIDFCQGIQKFKSNINWNTIVSSGLPDSIIRYVRHKFFKGDLANDQKMKKRMMLTVDEQEKEKIVAWTICLGIVLDPSLSLPLTPFATDLKITEGRLVKTATALGCTITAASHSEAISLNTTRTTE